MTREETKLQGMCLVTAFSEKPLDSNWATRSALFLNGRASEPETHAFKEAKVHAVNGIGIELPKRANASLRSGPVRNS